MPNGTTHRDEANSAMRAKKFLPKASLAMELQAFHAVLFLAPSALTDRLWWSTMSRLMVLKCFLLVK